jgi:hypothetical protein
MYHYIKMVIQFMNSQFKIPSNQGISIASAAIKISLSVRIELFMAAVRLMAQFSFVPTSYLIIVVLMLVLSLMYLIFQYARYRTL